MVGSLSLPPVATWDCDADGGFGADLADVGFILDYVAGLAAAEYDDAPLVLAARFEPAPRAPVAPTDPSPGGGAPTPGPPAGTMSGGVPSNVFTLGRAASSPTGVGTLVLNLPGPGVVSAIATASVTAGAARRIAVARVKKNVAKAGRVALRLKPSRRAKAILRKAGRLRSSVKITYTPTGGSPRSSTKALTFKLKRRRR
jgi:hypothetical protein